MRRCILNYLGVNCQNVSKLTSNVLKTEMYLYVYVCLCAYMYNFLFILLLKCAGCFHVLNAINNTAINMRM